MPQVVFRFYAELNDFLPRERRQTSFTHAYLGRSSVKDLIEALGVPHTEVDLILVDGVSVDFSYLPQDGSQISVYPVFEALDITPLVHLRPRPLRQPTFVLDAHLGKLASHLRLMGFDTLYQNNYADETLARISEAEKRILLTKDRGLLKRRQVTHGYLVRGIDPDLQIREVLSRFDLYGAVQPFTRCLSCNGLLEPVDKATVAEQIPADVGESSSEFRRCAACGKVYWRGSHYEHLRRFVEAVLADRPAQ